MKRIYLVHHPIKLNLIIKKSINTSILSDVVCGPMGLRKYIIETNDLHITRKLQKTSAWKYKIVILTDVLENYSLDHFTKMISAFLEKTVRAKPDGFDVMKFADPRTTHIYPIYRDDYLYITSSEEKIVTINPLVLVGLYPFFIDSNSWNYMKIYRPIAWGESVIVESSEADSSINDAEDTKRLMNYATRMMQRNNKEDIPALSYK